MVDDAGDLFLSRARRPKLWNSVKLVIHGVLLLILNNTRRFAFGSHCLDWKFVLPMFLYTICIFLPDDFHVLMWLDELIVPNCVHAKPRLLHAHSSHTSEELILPPINLQPSFLIICNGHPLVRPGAWRHGVAVSTTRWCRVQTNLSLNRSIITKLEG